MAILNIMRARAIMALFAEPVTYGCSIMNGAALGKLMALPIDNTVCVWECKFN